MEKVLIIADMEGCIGIYNLENSEYCRSMMEREVSLVIEYLLKQKECKIAVADSHNNGNTLCRLRDKYPDIETLSFFWNVKDIETYDYAVLTGFHARRGIDGILSHTLRPEIKELRIGNVICGEVSFIVNWLAYYSVKTILISGNRELNSEVKGKCAYFFESKSLDDLQNQKKVDIDGKFASLCEILESAWENRRLIGLEEYNRNEITIIFSQINILPLLPSSLYRIEKDKILFLDTKMFVEELYVLCQYINAAQAWLIGCLNKIKNIIRKVYPTKEDFVTEERELVRLLKVPYQKYLIDEIKLLNKRAEEIEREYIQD